MSHEVFVTEESNSYLFFTESSTGSVFGVPLAQCVETERALRRQQHGGSRASLASLGTLEKGDDVSERKERKNKYYYLKLTYRVTPLFTQK
jgi:hypothetical protein